MQHREQPPPAWRAVDNKPSTLAAERVQEMDQLFLQILQSRQQLMGGDIEEGKSKYCLMLPTFCFVLSFRVHVSKRLVDSILLLLPSWGLGSGE